MLGDVFNKGESIRVYPSFAGFFLKDSRRNTALLKFNLESKSKKLEKKTTSNILNCFFLPKTNTNFELI